MARQTEYPKETETQATTSPVPEEFDSPIAPQGYDPEFIEEIADMETPQQKRRKALRYLLYTALFIVALVFFCLPRNAELPADIPIPYGLEDRPLPASTLFLRQIAPLELGGFTRVHQDVARSFAEPFVGAEIATSIYTNPQGQAVTVSIIDAGSYINANRYLRGLEEALKEESGSADTISRIWLEHSFLEWEAPNLGSRAYGFAWSNERFYFSVEGAVKEHRDSFVENFPY